VPDRLKVQGVEVPTFLYGTAWKEERTEALVDQALAAGFRGIDTANQRKHYFEAGVGAALAKLAASERVGIFLQSKFTHRGGQDHRLPYDPAADMATQVRQSFESSLEHLGVQRLDSLILHGPMYREGLAGEDREVWRTFEALHDEGRVRLLGISNVSAGQVAELCRLARVRPAFVQNRCYARLGWDRAVREVCLRESVVYQGFSLLTANRRELQSRPLLAIAARHGKTPAQVVFAFARAVGMIRLTGSSDAAHLREDLASDDIELAPDEVAAIEKISG
jgi:diketogulonate reductase-like aldo/keto reductase